MKQFDKKSTDVKKTTLNPNEIDSTIKDSINRFETFMNLKNNKEMSKYIFENLYEALRELSESIALNNG